MVLDRALGRNVEKFFRHEQRDEGHDLQVGLERLELGPDLGLAVGRRLIDRKRGRERRLLQRIGFGTLLLRRDIDRDHFVATLEQRLQDGLAERLLAVHHDTHSDFLQNLRRHARESRHPVVACDYWVPAFAGTTLYAYSRTWFTPPRRARPSPAR